MGEARRRGTYEERKAQAIRAGRIKVMTLGMGGQRRARPARASLAGAAMLGIVGALLGGRGGFWAATRRRALEAMVADRRPA